MIFLWWLLFGFIYTVLQLKKDDDIAAELLFFWLNPAWDLFDWCRDWLLILWCRYEVWRVRRKLNKADKKWLDEIMKKNDV